MIQYHDFQRAPNGVAQNDLDRLSEWQSKRLQNSHHDFYTDPEYSDGLKFLLSELYSPQDFSSRDNDLERIFPKILKFLPEAAIETVAALIELNLLTQKLDQELGKQLFTGTDNARLNQSSYCKAYRSCQNKPLRLKQISLIDDVGQKLDKYARSHVINYSLKLTTKPAELAGLEALHSFITRGFNAFHGMSDIKHLMHALVSRERTILENIFQNAPEPFMLQTSL